MLKEELWQNVLAQIQLDISRANFATWFKNTKIVSKKDNEVLIAVPNSFSKEWISKKYHNTILKILRNLDKDIRVIKYIVRQPKESDNRITKKTKTNPENQLIFEELKVDQKTNLNVAYTFDNFIIGSFNQLAHAAAWSVTENPGFNYNPLFVYGKVGLGKTHLLEATGNKIINNFKNKKVRYMPAELFTSQVVKAIMEKNINALKSDLKKIDVLIMDDVQFLAGKEKTQEEFFHIFNALYENNKQIIISSDRPPKAIPALEERLRSRFEGGMIADISLPDFETRMAILRAYSEEKETDIRDDILEYIAVNFQENIRELRGALNKIIAFRKMTGETIDLESAKKMIKSLNEAPPRITNFKQIINAVSNFYHINEKEILDNTRRKEIVKPRQVAMYLLRIELKESYPLIGRRFKGKDHSTVIYACDKISREIEDNPNLFNELNAIRQRIYNN
jgi:chromosomal replication initiator protein